MKTHGKLAIPSSEHEVFTARSDEEMQAALDRLSQHAFECGLYDRNEMPRQGTDE